LRQKSWAGTLLLALLLFRAYVPVGYMPAKGGPFLLEICPAGLMVGMAAHHAHQHGGSHADFENCPFGSAPAAAPISHHLDVVATGQVALPLIIALESPRYEWKLARSHQPRGPPSLS
jgi:hypothetical protein